MPVGRLVKRRQRSERGAAAIVSAFVALFLFAFAALAVDLGKALDRKGDTQIQADVAALAGAPDLPGTKSATDPSVVAVADYMLKNYVFSEDGVAAPTAQQLAARLVDGSDANGEVYFPSSTKMRVVSPQARVNFLFAGVFDLLGGGNTANNINVSSDATVQLGTPDSLGVLPMYVANPSPGDQACDYGLQTLTDPPNGQVVPPSVPTLFADTDDNGNTLTGLQAFAPPGTPVSTIPQFAANGRITLSGSFTNATRVGFFRSDDPAQAPVEVARGAWVSPAGTNPYTQNNGSIQVDVPSSVTATSVLWYVRVYRGGTGGSANKWSEKDEAQPLSVGDAPFECVGGSRSGNFGTVKFPRSTGSAPQWVVPNIARGLEPPLSLSLMPGSPPPWQCSASTPGAVIAPPLGPGFNCVDTDTGLTANDATAGLVTGGSDASGAYSGLLASNSSSADPDGSGGCSPTGNTNSTLVLGQPVNNDILTCFLTDTTTSLGDVARRNYSGGVKFHPAIYNSPRFAYVPVFSQETVSGGSNRYSIVDFRPAFITDQPMNATKANNLVNGGTNNGLGTNSNRVRTIKVVFFHPDSLPDGAPSTPIGPVLGPDFPTTRKLVD